MGLWTKGAEKYPNFGYLDNRCHGNKKTSPELTKHLKGYGILSGGAFGGTRIVVMDSCYHGNHCVAMVTKKCLETHGTLLISSVATPLTRPSERVKALVCYKDTEYVKFFGPYRTFCPANRQSFARHAVRHYQIEMSGQHLADCGTLFAIHLHILSSSWTFWKTALPDMLKFCRKTLAYSGVLLGHLRSKTCACK